MKAVLQYPASPRFRAMLEDIASPELRIEIVPVEDKARFAATMQDADVLLHVLEPVTAEVIAKAPELKLIQKIGVGVNTIDLEAARAHGVAVANIPGSNAQAVAELTILLMLASLRRLVTLDEATRRGESWPPAPELVDRFGELGDRTVGLVGYGEIASRVAVIAQAFGARVIYTARSRKSAAQAEWRDLNALLAEADIVSLHLPETDGTRGLVDAEAFQRMPQGAVLINTARGGLVDEAALVRALQDGQLGAAGLDVFASEPLDPQSLLTALPNIVLAPHIGWLTIGTLRRSLPVIEENCRRVRAGHEVIHRVV